jgi:hypothetical protein
MNGAVFSFDFYELGVGVRQVERFMGYSEGEDTGLVRDLILEILEESETIADVRAEYRIFTDFKAIEATKQLKISDVCFDVHNIVFSQLRNSECAALFLCTAGEELGRRSREAMAERDLLRGYVLDVVGSEIAEAAADLIQAELKLSAENGGYSITNRYSPGYCGWSVSEQHKLFGLIPYNYCGIRLTESALMDPVKSVSGIIGVGKKVRFNDYTCSMCDMKDCIYRRMKGVKA